MSYAENLFCSESSKQLSGKSDSIQHKQLIFSHIFHKKGISQSVFLNPLITLWNHI